MNNLEKSLAIINKEAKKMAKESMKLQKKALHNIKKLKRMQEKEAKNN